MFVGWKSFPSTTYIWFVNFLQSTDILGFSAEQFVWNLQCFQVGMCKKRVSKYVMVFFGWRFFGLRSPLDGSHLLSGRESLVYKCLSAFRIDTPDFMDD